MGYRWVGGVVPSLSDGSGVSSCSTNAVPSMPSDTTPHEERGNERERKREGKKER